MQGLCLRFAGVTNLVLDAGQLYSKAVIQWRNQLFDNIVVAALYNGFSRRFAVLKTWLD